MDATIFDGTTTSPLTKESAGGTPSGFVWYDLDASGDGATGSASLDRAREALGWLGVPTAGQELLLKPNRSAQVGVGPDGITGVTWLGGDVDGAPPPEIHLLWTQQRLITVRWGGAAAIDRIREQVRARGQRLFADPISALAVLLLLINSSVDRRLTELDLALYEIDDAILQPSGKVPLARLRALRSEVSALQLRYAGLVDAASSAVVDPDLPGGDPGAMKQLQEYVTHVGDTYHHVRELADGARAALQDYQTSLGDKQGDRINQLTIVSVVFLPISFLTGYFGMNFDWLDDQLMTMSSWLLWGVALPVLVLAGSVLALRQFGYLSRSARRSAAAAGSGVAEPS